MSLTDSPQLIYMFLMLPALFGFTLMGDGIYKIAHHEISGLISTGIGVVCIGAVIFAYFFFSNFMSQII